MSGLQELQKVDPPVPGCGYQVSNVSLMLLKEPKPLKSGKPLVGFMKLRGSHATMELASKDAERIINEVDSKFMVMQFPSGRWIPITEDSSICGDITDVADRDHQLPNTDGKLSSLRDQAAKEKQSSDQKIIRELREREDQLKNEGDVTDDPSSLSYYAMKRVTEMRLTENIESLQKKLAMMTEKRGEVWTELRTLEGSYPEYTDQWLDNYNEKRKESGLPDYVPSGTAFDEYNAFTIPSSE